MRLFTWLQTRTSNLPARARSPRRAAARRFRPRLEMLEDRALLTAYTAATATDLIADINAANKSNGTNTIMLTAPSTSPYVFLAANNTKDGPTVLPVIQKGDDLTIITGNGSTANPGYLATLDAAGHGRLFDVASDASLTLEFVRLQNGTVLGSGVAAEGGAIQNRGTLVLSDSVVVSNDAEGLPGTSSQPNKPGAPGQDAAGGGIWSSGSLTLENHSVIGNNLAAGGDGGQTQFGTGLGGKALGGGIYVAGGIALIEASSVLGNRALGGAGDNTLANLGGSAYGGGVYVAAGSVTLDSDTVGSPSTTGYVSYFTGDEGNSAQGGPSTDYGLPISGTAFGGGLYVAGGTVILTGDVIEANVAATKYYNNAIYYVDGYGGGIFIASGATVNLDSYTLANTIGNIDSSFFGSGSTTNIDGKFDEF